MVAVKVAVDHIPDRKRVISSRICLIRALAAEGFEWVSTTRTWSRLTMTAALQFSIAVGFAIAP